MFLFFLTLKQNLQKSENTFFTINQKILRFFRYKWIGMCIPPETHFPHAFSWFWGTRDVQIDFSDISQILPEIVNFQISGDNYSISGDKYFLVSKSLDRKRSFAPTFTFISQLYSKIWIFQICFWHDMQVLYMAYFTREIYTCIYIYFGSDLPGWCIQYIFYSLRL